MFVMGLLGCQVCGEPGPHDEKPLIVTPFARADDPDHTAEGCARKFSEVRPLFASDRDPGDEDDAQRWLLSPRWAADRLNYEHDLDSVSSGHVTRRSR